jgi:diphthamide synthase (EF-2-diphthine--ammonia ligase)
MRIFCAILPEGVDPCGENGEFHSAVYAGPMFREPIPIESGEVVERDGFVFADVRLAEPVPARG